MIQISRMADYGIVLLTRLADQQGVSFAARDLSVLSGLPLPMVSKVLKKLSSEGLISSTRGVNGGYSLSRPPSEISAVEIITALDGPIAITRCVDNIGDGCCTINSKCTIKNYWELINERIVASISTISLADITKDNFAPDPQTV